MLARTDINVKAKLEDWEKDSRNMTEIVRDAVQDADMVLVGIGEAFAYDWDNLSENARYQEIERDILKDPANNWIVPFLQKMTLQEKRDGKLDQAYEILRQMLADKNYYIVSLCMDDYLFAHDFREDRVVAPCGGFRKMQCDEHCTGELYDIPQSTYDDVVDFFHGEKKFTELQEPRCSKCGKSLRFNQIGVSRYAEEGYLDRWSDYTKWLQGTVNRKLCVLELGVGMEYPSVIRFPFEKIVLYNQKSFLYRVHPFLQQIGESIAERGMGIRENPLDFLIKGFEK